MYLEIDHQLCTPDDDRKFILWQERDRILGRLFSAIRTHAQETRKIVPAGTDRSFLGAGYVKRESGAEYDSNSCKDKYGYDRPLDEEEGKRLLRELEDAVRKRCPDYFLQRKESSE